MKKVSKKKTKKNITKKTSKKTSKKKITKSSLKKNTTKKKSKTVKNSKVKKTALSKVKKTPSKKQSALKTKLIPKKTTTNIVTKPKKQKVTFETKIQEIFEKLINKNKIDGIYTNKIIEKAIPKKFRESENINKLQELIKKANIKVYSEEEAKELQKLSKGESVKSEEASDEEEKKQTGKTDDPVRLYLRDMGAVELLSREGEIAIAKRIEAGREKMIGAICESPMTIRSIINWKDAIKDGTMLLRDIVDLEATYDMSDISDNKIDDTFKLIEASAKNDDDQKSE